MINLLPLLLLYRPTDVATPTWATELLRHAPTRAMPVRRDLPFESPRVSAASAHSRTGGFTEHRNPPYDPAEQKAWQDEDNAYRKRIYALADKGRYEEVYRMARSRATSEVLQTAGDWRLDACLLTGRFLEAEDLIMMYLQNSPDVEGHFGNGSQLYAALSLAVAMQGRVYAGQGKYLLDVIHERVKTYHPELLEYVESIPVPTSPKDTVTVSVLALSETGANANPDLYREWVLRLDPRCVLAARVLVESYSDSHRFADAARVASGMVKSLPSGTDRNGFALRLEGIRQKTAVSAPVKQGR